MIQGIHHIAIIIESIKSIEFYRLLGFEETFRKVRKTDTIVLMKGHGIQLEFFIDPSHQRIIGDTPIGLRHFALKVDCIKDELERLKKESIETIEFSPIMKDWLGKRFCHIKDYEGICIELHE